MNVLTNITYPGPKPSTLVRRIRNRYWFPYLQLTSVNGQGISLTDPIAAGETVRNNWPSLISTSEITVKGPYFLRVNVRDAREVTWFNAFPGIDPHAADEFTFIVP